MTGLMHLFGRHSGNMTNFRIFKTESRPISLEGRYVECEELGVRRACGAGLECPVDADTRAMANGWALAIPILGTGWVGWVVPLPRTHPAVQPAESLRQPARVTCHGWDGLGATGTCTYDRFSMTQGDPRGGKRTVLAGLA